MSPKSEKVKESGGTPGLEVSSGVAIDEDTTAGDPAEYTSAEGKEGQDLPQPGQVVNLEGPELPQLSEEELVDREEGEAEVHDKEQALGLRDPLEEDAQPVSEIEVRIDRNQPYFSQRNNEIDPLGTCIPTALVAALTYSGHDLSGKRGTKADHVQPEDDLTDFLRNDPRVLAKFKEWYPQEAASKQMPNEFHEVVEYGLRLWLGEDADLLSFGASVEQIALHLVKRLGGMTTGLWPYFSKVQNALLHLPHAVTFVGFRTLQQDILEAKTAEDIRDDLITGFIIDDPYGDYHTLYASIAGNDVFLPMDDFVKIVRAPGQTRKLFHFIQAPSAV